MDLDPEAARVLELAREARTPSEDDKQRVARRVAAGLGLSVAASSAAAAAQLQGASVAKSAGAAALLKWWIAGGALLAAVGGYAVLSSSGPRAADEREGRRARAATAAPAAAIAPATVTAPESPSSAAAAAEPAPARAERSSARRRAGAALQPAEIELLHRAQAAWRARDANAALALVETHRARYPHSELRLERDVLQVLSLCELGKQAEAARLGRGLLERAPRSPLRAAIEQSCALK